MEPSKKGNIDNCPKCSLVAMAGWDCWPRTGIKTFHFNFNSISSFFTVIGKYFPNYASALFYYLPLPYFGKLTSQVCFQACKGLNTISGFREILKYFIFSNWKTSETNLFSLFVNKLPTKVSLGEVFLVKELNLSFLH